MLEYIGKKEVWSLYLKSKRLLVSSKGRIKLVNSDKILKTSKQTQGYHMVSFTHLDGRRVSKSVHRLVAETFLFCKNKDNMEVNHIDGNKSNNSLENLEWVTRTENLAHARAAGLFKRQFGSENGRYVHTEDKIENIKQLKAQKLTFNEIAMKLNLTHGQVTSLYYRRCK